MATSIDNSVLSSNLILSLKINETTIDGPLSGSLRPEDRPPPLSFDTASSATKRPSLYVPDVWANSGLGDIVDLLSQLNAKLTETQVSTSHSFLNVNLTQQKIAQNEARKQTEIVQAKAKEAAANAEKDKIGGWLKAIFGLIGAALGMALAVTATFATFGGAAAAIVGAAVGMAMAIMEVVNMSLKEAKVTAPDAQGNQKPVDVSLGGMVNAIVDQQIASGQIVVVKRDAEGNVIRDPASDAKRAPGAIEMDEKQVQEWKMGWTVTSNLLVAAGTIASGIGGGVSMYRAAKSVGEDTFAIVEKLSEKMEMVVSGLSLSSEVAEASTSVYQGSVGINTAVISQDSDRARAMKLFMESTLKDLSSRMEQSNDTINHYMKAWSDSVENMAKLMEQISSTDSHIARNNA